MKCGSIEEQKVLAWVAQQAKIIVGAKKVILFGSRARADGGDRSDFDIALDASMPEKIPDLRARLEDNPLTLLAFDIVNLNAITPEFRERIEREGREIF